MTNIIWIVIGILLAFGAGFIVWTLASRTPTPAAGAGGGGAPARAGRGFWSWVKIILLTGGAIAAVITALIHIHQIANFFAYLGSLPSWVWIRIGIGALVLTVIITTIVKTWSSWTWSWKKFFQALSVCFGLAFLAYAGYKHQTLNQAMFNAWLYTTSNLEVMLAIIGAIAATWLFSNGTGSIPVRRILGCICVAIVCFFLARIVFPNAQWVPMWQYYWGNYPVQIMVGGAVLLTLIVLFCFAAGRNILRLAGKAAAIVAVVLIGVWAYGKVNQPNPNKPVRYITAKEGATRVEVSSTGFIHIRPPDEKNLWAQAIFGPGGEGDIRPTTLLFRKKGQLVYLKPTDPIEKLQELPQDAGGWEVKAVLSQFVSGTPNYTLTLVTWK